MLTLVSFLAAATMPMPALVGAPPTSSPQNPCPVEATGGNLLEPPQLYPTNGVVHLTLTLTQSLYQGGTRLCWTYDLKDKGQVSTVSVPPTLNVRQGDRLSIELINALPVPGAVSTPPPAPPPLSIDRGAAGMDAAGMAQMGDDKDPWALMCGQPQLAPTPTPDPVTGRIYGYHRSPWNEANLHFHGLNTSPKPPGDDVVNVLLCPNANTRIPTTYQYTVDIPRDEPPGLYWYHPHAHGESLYQVFQGLTGAIVVHALVPAIPDKLPSRIAIVRDAPAHQGVAKYALGAANLSGLPSFTEIRKQYALGMPDFTRNPGGDPFQPEDHCPGPKVPYNTTSLTINGVSLPLNGNEIQGLPTAKIGLGETQYWRLANTDAQTTLDLVMLVNGHPNLIPVVSRDGVPIVTKNGHPTYQAVPMSHVLLPPAGRIEFYVTGTTANADMVFRTRAIATGCVGDTDLARNLFNVKVGAKAVAQHVVVPQALDPVPQRFSDLALVKPVRKRAFVLTEYLRSDEPEPDFYITEISNPKAVEHPYRMSGPPDTVVRDGTVEEWTIVNYTNEVHGFHIHQIHFMPIAGTTLEGGLGQLLDTIYIPHGGYDANGKFVPRGVKLLMDFRAKDIVGTFVYHCHFLEHEDNGMMARIQVVP